MPNAKRMNNSSANNKPRFKKQKCNNEHSKVASKYSKVTSHQTNKNDKNVSYNFVSNYGLLKAR